MDNTLELKTRIKDLENMLELAKAALDYDSAPNDMSWEQIKEMS